MKKTSLTLLALAFTLGTATADDVIENAMKKHFKPEDAVSKKVGKGEATDAEIADLLKSVESIAAAKAPQGSATSWEAKTKALVDGLKKVQKDKTAVSDFKKAANCKACHDMHKPKE